MAEFKCKMCGDTLEIQEGSSVAVCDSCGYKQTIPNSTDENAIQSFQEILGRKDDDELACVCQSRIEEIKESEERIAKGEVEKKRKRRRFAIATSIVIASVLLVSILIKVFRYKSAVELMENGKYESAIVAFNELYGFMDSETKIKACKYVLGEMAYSESNYLEAYTYFNESGSYSDAKDWAEKSKSIMLKNIKVGDTVVLGTYDNVAIEWYVLKVSDGKAFLLSKYALCQKAYNKRHVDITWAECTLRTWLNGSFYNSAFSTEEKGMIISTSVTNPDNPRYGTAGGADTTDKIFLLSISEINAYSSYEMCEYRNGRSCFWWLRSTGYSSNRAANVQNDGDVGYYGRNVLYVFGVRPALWINL